MTKLAAKMAAALALLALAAAALHILRRPRVAPAPQPAPGTLEMAARLEKIAREADPARSPFLNRGRAELYRRLLAEPLGPQEEMDARLHLGTELLRAGDSEAAIEELLAAEPLVERLDPDDRAAYRCLLHQFLGIAYLRLGEQENCIAHHDIDSCLLPIQGGGIHGRRRGSHGAIEHLRKAVELNPGDLGSVWLINIAFMTLGEYPDKVPSSLRIPPRVFDSEYDIGRFRDAAARAGVAEIGRSGGAVLEDFDGDGFLDIICSSWGLEDPLRFFRSKGDGTFEERSAEAGLTGLTGGLNLCHADYDNDGRPDVLVLRGAWLHAEGRMPNSLLANRGDGTFEDVTERAGLLSYHPTQTAAWGDFDGDGWLDLFIGNESDEEEEHPCELFHSNGDGTFSERASAFGVASIGFVKAVVWGDYDNDGRLDLYLSRLGEENVLYRNAGPAPKGSWRFEDVSRKAGVTEPIDSFPAWFWDYDNDGWLDLFASGYGWRSSAADVAADYLKLPSQGTKPRLYRNRGDGTFSDETRAAGLDRVLISMGANFGDLDNDGWLDLYVGTGEPDLAALMPNRMFRNAGGVRFQNVTTSGGFGHLQKGHGIAFGDVDNDGDQDIYAVFGGAYEGDTFPNALFENPGHGNHWLTLCLEGVRSNRSAIGARIEVKVRDGGKQRSIHAVVSTGGSFGSSSLQQEVGLGKASEVISITIAWPSGERQVFEEVPLDAVLSVREGDSMPRIVERRRIVLGGR